MIKINQLWTGIKKKLELFLWVVIIILSCWFIFLLFNDTVAKISMELIGANDKTEGANNKIETLKFIGLVMSWILAVIGALAINRRADAQVKNNELVEKGHNQDRFKTATEHLVSEKSSVRIASFREFYHLARDGNEDLQGDVFEILCDHLRNTAEDENYPGGKPRPTEGGKIYGPTTEVQKLLDILFKPNDKNEYIFENFTANLRGVYLDSVDFRNAILEEADFSGATLSNVGFVNANLTNANLSHISILSDNRIMNNFSGAKFHGANLSYAKMQGGDFACVEFQGAIFYDAKLQHAILASAKMQGANFSEAKLHGVNLSNAIFHGADLSGADLGNARLENTEFQGAELSANFGSGNMIVCHHSDGRRDILGDSVFRGEIFEQEANKTKNILHKCRSYFGKKGLKRYTSAVENNKGKDTTYGLSFNNPEDKKLIATIKRCSSKPQK